MSPAGFTEMITFSGFVSRMSTRSFGRVTGTDVVTTGMVIRKMISSTSITSTRGVVLMADMTSSSSPEAGPTAIAMARPRLRGLAGGTHDHGIQLVGELAHFVHDGLVAARQVVVRQHRGNRDREADGRHDQRLTDGASDLVDRSLAGDAD